MKKRIVSILLCAVMLLCTIPISVSAAAVAPEGDTLTFTGLELYNDVLNVEGSTLYTNGGSGGGTSYTVDTTTYASENAISFNRKSNATRQWKTFNMNFASKYNASLAEYTYVVIKAKSPADTEYSGFTIGTNQTSSVGIHEYLMCNGIRDTWYIKVIDLTAIATDNAGNTTWDSTGLVLNGAVSMISNAELVIGGFALCKNETAANAAAQGFKGANDFVLPDTTGLASVISTSPIILDCDRTFYDTLQIGANNDYTYNPNGYVELTGITNASDAYNHIPIFDDISMSENVYQYMAIKYKYDKAYDNAVLSLYNPNFARTVDGEIATTADGLWHTQVVDLSKVHFDSGNSLWGADSTRSIETLWLMPFGWDKQFGAVFSLDYIAFFSDEASAIAYTRQVEYRGCQIGNDKTSVRFIGTVDTDSLDAIENVGFHVKATYTDGTEKCKTWTSTTTTVYNSILADGGSCSAESVAGKYIYAFTITDIPSTIKPLAFEVTPTKDGEKLKDKSVQIVFEDGIGGEYKSLYVDEEYLDALDATADNLKNNVLNSQNTVDPDTWSGNVYYVSNDGDDNADGKTPSTAWKTLAKVNSTAFSNGDAVLFARGGLWRGTSLIARPGVTYSAYGEGAKPKIYGSVENGAGSTENWTLVEGTDNIYKYHTQMTDVGNIVFNEGEKTEDYGYRVYWNFTVNGNTITRKMYSSSTTLGTNGEALPSDFSSWTSVFKKDLYFLSLPKITESSSGTYTTVGNTGALYLRCDAGNPAEVFSSIEFGTLPTSETSTDTYGHIVNVRNNFGKNQPIKIDNLCIKFGGAHGIGGGDNENLTVTNCEIAWIGGTIYNWSNNNGTYKSTALGNGVEVVRNCKDFIVQNNWIYQCYDTGITNQSGSGDTYTVENITYDSNLIEYTAMCIEIWIYDNPDDTDVSVMKNLSVTNNIIRFVGYGIGEARPNFVVGGAVFQTAWTTNATFNKSENYNITGNTFYVTNGFCEMLYLVAGDSTWLPDLEGNTYVDIYGRRLGRYAGKASDDTTQYASVFSDYDFDGNVADTIKEVYGDVTAEIGIITNASYVMHRYKYLSHDAWHQGVSLLERK